MNYSKSARRRAKKAAQAGLPDLAQIPRRERDGKTTRIARTSEKISERHPDKLALKARARQMGKDPMQYDQMRHQALGEPAGQAIFSVLPEDQAKKCWDVYKDLTAAEFRYHKIVLGRSCFCKTAKIEFTPERLQASADDPAPDMRDENERHRDAVNARQRWKGIAMHLPANQRRTISEVFLGQKEPMRDGMVTASGRVLVLALQNVVDAVDNYR